ncbi:pyridoxamine 5'-phosphate oxidase family protein [Solibacillus merdavium]|uniref:Pyridoxamine 5'-phosphate oxidase family protein n=1 Tax=Solibacillus merdavium TaxID=2762218 RepID=A0ABR8XMR5_9BACL|nr:pyridoxamine 5'-phosphate oxidase family protein [Solibacillus merdavium]MBD8033224.1 pyridoxamine 5'-phosphate oxidase family protein [Solibacillus merdavium]
METLKEKILSIINDNNIGTMATLNGRQPYVRYMTFTNEDFVLYATTTEDSQKVMDLNENPYTHILLGYTKEDMDAPYVEITAKLSEIKDDTLKLKITNFFKEIFTSDEGEMVTIQLDPISIKLMNDGEPQELNF